MWRVSVIKSVFIPSPSCAIVIGIFIAGPKLFVVAGRFRRELGRVGRKTGLRTSPKNRWYKNRCKNQDLGRRRFLVAAGLVDHSARFVDYLPPPRHQTPVMNRQRRMSFSTELLTANAEQAIKELIRKTEVEDQDYRSMMAEEPTLKPTISQEELEEETAEQDEFWDQFLASSLNGSGAPKPKKVDVREMVMAFGLPSISNSFDQVEVLRQKQSSQKRSASVSTPATPSSAAAKLPHNEFPLTLETVSENSSTNATLEKKRSTSSMKSASPRRSVTSNAHRHQRASKKGKRVSLLPPPDPDIAESVQLANVAKIQGVPFKSLSVQAEKRAENALKMKGMELLSVFSKNQTANRGGHLVQEGFLSTTYKNGDFYEGQVSSFGNEPAGIECAFDCRCTVVLGTASGCWSLQTPNTKVKNGAVCSLSTLAVGYAGGFKVDVKHGYGEENSQLEHYKGEFALGRR